MSKYSERLLDLGVTPNLLGFNYLCEACEIVESNRLASATRQVYPLIAGKYNTTSSRVERAIRHTKDIIFNKCGPDKLHSYFRNVIDPKKGNITNMQLVHMIVYNENKEN